MDQTKELVKTIVEGLQEKRGKNIVTVDLSQTSGAICQYMVICEGNTPTQVSALSDSVWDFARKNANEKPLSIDGTQGAQWIGMDYGTVLVHIFLPEQRAFYNLENLWADSKVIQVPNFDDNLLWKIKTIYLIKHRKAGNLRCSALICIGCTD